MKRLVLVSTVVTAIFLFACEAENVEDLRPVEDTGVITNPNDSTNNDTTGGGGGTTVSFATQIKPLISSNCAIPGCHASNANFPTLETYAQINSSKSRVNARVSANTMPPGGPLPQNDKDLIATWISEGAKNN